MRFAYDYRAPPHDDFDRYTDARYQLTCQFGTAQAASIKSRNANTDDSAASACQDSSSATGSPRLKTLVFFWGGVFYFNLSLFPAALCTQSRAPVQVHVQMSRRWTKGLNVAHAHVSGAGSCLMKSRHGENDGS